MWHQITLYDLVPSNKSVPVTAVLPHAYLGFHYLCLCRHAGAQDITIIQDSVAFTLI